VLNPEGQFVQQEKLNEWFDWKTGTWVKPALDTVKIWWVMLVVLT